MSRFTGDSRLVEDLAIDSLDLVGVILQLQDHFEVVIEEDAVPHLCRVADLAAYLWNERKQLNDREPGWFPRCHPCRESLDRTILHGWVRRIRRWNDAGSTSVRDS